MHLKNFDAWLRFGGRDSRGYIAGVSTIWYKHDGVALSRELERFAAEQERFREHMSGPFEFCETQLAKRDHYSFWKCGV